MATTNDATAPYMSVEIAGQSPSAFSGPTIIADLLNEVSITNGRIETVASRLADLNIRLFGTPMNKIADPETVASEANAETDRLRIAINRSAESISRVEQLLTELERL